MRNYKAENVDEYIKNAPKEQQDKLKEIRAVVKSAVPEAEESISWGVPFYKYHGLLAGFSAGKNHVLFGLAFALDNDFRKKLEEKGYGTGIKTVQIKYDQKVPEAEIKELLKARARANEIK